MSLEHAEYDQVVVGWPVYTRGGERIGEMAEMRDRCFKVDASMAPDYWLRTDCIMAASGGQVLLNVDKDQLGDYKVEMKDEG
jgi:hypothetical protein